jgi:peptidylamidoglycolate lyase
MMNSRNWPDLPNGFVLGNPTGIGIDSFQNIFIFHRAGRVWPLDNVMPETCISSKTILMLDRDSGKMIDSWGEGLFVMPHGLTIDRHDNIWLTDTGLHQVFKFNRVGKHIMTLGEAGVSSHGPAHFSYPTDIAVTRDGSFYVSDGYGNSRVIKFSPDGKYLFEWGKKGNKAGEFKLPHAIELDDEENVYVADRENNRIQVFTPAGKFIKQWTDPGFGKMSSVVFDKTRHGFFAVDFVVSPLDANVSPLNANQPASERLESYDSGIIGFDASGNIISKFRMSNAWYHNIALDDQENIYVTDILGNRIQKFGSISW